MQGRRPRIATGATEQPSPPPPRKAREQTPGRGGTCVLVVVIFRSKYAGQDIRRARPNNSHIAGVSKNRLAQKEAFFFLPNPTQRGEYCNGAN